MIVGMILGAWLYAEGGRSAVVISAITVFLLEVADMALKLSTGKDAIGWVLK